MISDRDSCDLSLDDGSVWDGSDEGSLWDGSDEKLGKSSDLDREWQRRHDQFHTVS